MATLRIERAVPQPAVKKPTTNVVGERIMTIAVLPVVAFLIAFRPDLLEDRDQD